MIQIRYLLTRLLAYIALVPFRKVTIGLINGKVVTGRVQAVLWGSRAVVMSYTPDSAVVRSRADEGISWCRGWRGQDVDALLAGWALR